MFDRIAPGYDLLNRAMTLRIDRRWRRSLVRELVPVNGERFLDLCAGTLDLSAELRSRTPGVRIVAVDFSLPMLRRGKTKIALPVVAADALTLPFPRAHFDAAAVVFGLRNLESLERGLLELARVLRPGGRVGVLELFRPVSASSRLVHLLYNRLTLPALGRLLSPDPSAYRYLVESMERFVSRPEFEDALSRAGFAAVRGRALFPGACGMVLAELRSGT
jgi:ubiquinone/menaquinone biosynthesis methyltransferase